MDIYGLFDGMLDAITSKLMYNYLIFIQFYFIHLKVSLFVPATKLAYFLSAKIDFIILVLSK
jgi:hypothetical protein